MKNKVTKKTKRRIRILSFCILGTVTLTVASIYHDWKQINNNKSLIKSLSGEYQNLLDEETALSSEVTKFQDPDYIARYAREKFLYSLPGEIIIKTPK